MSPPRVWWDDWEDDPDVDICNPCRVFHKLVESSRAKGGGLYPGEAALALLAGLDRSTAFWGGINR